ncbi:MAG: sigma 54-interacting transcriptional regulator, partial [Oscillibacter sp.]|nr:sigma 54-interacting transcriptional regulator [Oscillibacter sp.]
MFKLMQLLDLDISIINRNLQRHIHSVVESNEGFHSNYVYGYLKSEMLSTVVNTSENGMLLVDGSFQPVYANKQALKIFHAVNKNQIHITDFVPPEVLSASEPPDEPAVIDGDEYSVEKNPIRLMDDVVGYYIILQDYTKAQSQKQLHARAGFAAKYTFKDIVSESQEMAQVIDTARQIASADDTITIYGESGTGKELFAQSIHNASRRRKGPFIAINCAALPDTLLESELFGYEPGSFTGASARGRKGLLELAMHGTVFLDEIGEISPKFQASFLRAIQERQIIRVGGKELIDIDVRFITATNRDLRQKVREGAFRSDLYFRLNVLPLSLPPLRRRRADLAALMKRFLRELYPGVTQEEFAFLNRYGWPGNVRELENACTFYRTMHRFPDYVYTGAAVHSPAGGAEGRFDLLRLIRQNTGPAHGIGRTNLLYQLRGRYPQLSD